MPDKEAIEKVPPSTVNQNNFFGNSLSNKFFGPLLNPAQITGQQPALPVFSTDNFVNGNLANFDAQYQVNGPVPKTGTLFITHKIFLNFPANMTKAERTTFETDFKKSINDAWSNKHLLTLNNPGFSPYQCKVDVTALTVTDKKDAHTIINVVKPGEKEKRFRSRVSSQKKQEDSETTHNAKLDFRDPSKPEDRKTHKPDFIKHVGNFDFDSALINKDCADDIAEIKNFINSKPNSKTPGACKFSLHYVGRASSEGSKEYNKKLSQKRVDSIQPQLDAISGFCLSITEIAGEESATKDAEFRRVNVAVFLADNDGEKDSKQNVAAHEFGHMIGFGDEYVETVPEIPGTSAKFLGDKPSHFEAVKIMAGEKAADELLIKKDDSIMSDGSSVKQGHYAFFAGAIEIMTRNQLPALPPGEQMHWIVQ